MAALRINAALMLGTSLDYLTGFGGSDTDINIPDKVEVNVN